jgi:A/G-specific adenine glycosylase
MPWRETSDPYAIWVSEVMLQQTRVDTVRPYFERWMARFPTTRALAAADLDDVLLHWQGLGYYGRARNLHRAAAEVRERFGGEVPEDVANLRTLPGVGEYTAGAVASIAFGAPVPAVDGNVRRVLARLWGLEDPGAAELRRLAAAQVPADRPGDFNQGLMELGATICTPRSPDCPACPVAAACRARQAGMQELWPRARVRKPVPHEAVATAVLQRPNGTVLLVRRPEAGFLGGMWEFPSPSGSPWVAGAARDALSAAALEPVEQAYSHKRVTYRPTVYRVGGGVREVDGPDRDARWEALDALDRLALPVAQQKIATLVRRLG